MSFRKAQRGAMLVEYIIGAALLGVILVFVLDLQNRNDLEMRAKSEAEGQAQFIQIASQYFLNNRAAYDTAMDTGTGADQYCLVGVSPDGTGGTQKNNTTLKTCAFDATLLIAKGQWPEGLATETRNGRFTVILRRSYDSTPSPTGGHEAFFVLASPSGTLTATTMTKETSTALAVGKTTLGSVGGYVPIGAVGACSTSRASTTYQACGDQWQVDMANFINSSELTTFGAALPN